MVLPNDLMEVLVGILQRGPYTLLVLRVSLGNQIDCPVNFFPVHPLPQMLRLRHNGHISEATDSGKRQNQEIDAMRMPDG
jgi:hypothetical protein